jgi:hypothetical protein
MNADSLSPDSLSPRIANLSACATSAMPKVCFQHDERARVRGRSESSVSCRASAEQPVPRAR